MRISKSKASREIETTRTGPYWIAMKANEFLVGLDAEGKPIHTTEEKEAKQFDNFSEAMLYLSLGYSILRIN